MNLTGRAWEEVRDQPLDPFVPLLETLRREWREPSGEWARLPGGEDCAAFGLGDTRVVKLVPPGTAVDREIGLLGAVEGRLPVVTPRVLGRWEHEGWAALLLTRVPGRTARQVWPSLDDGQKGRILQRLGETLATLHTLPVPPVLRSWERSVRHGPVAAAWVAKHAPPPGTPRFLHGDLTDENVLLVGDQVGGILDFGGSWAGDPPLDVITPGLFLAGGRPALLGALLDGMGQRRAPEELLAWHLLHPFSSVPRDFAMGGLPPDAPVEAGVALWRTT